MYWNFMKQIGPFICFWIMIFTKDVDATFFWSRYMDLFDDTLKEVSCNHSPLWKIDYNYLFFASNQ